MYVYTEKDLESIRKEVLEEVQDITSLAVNPGTGFVAWYPTLADKLAFQLGVLP